MKASNYNNGVYWYNKSKASFGFSNIENIDLSLADIVGYGKIN